MWAAVAGRLCKFHFWESERGNHLHGVRRGRCRWVAGRTGRRQAGRLCPISFSEGQRTFWFSYFFFFKWISWWFDFVTFTVISFAPLIWFRGARKTARKLPGNCSETAPKLLGNCSETALNLSVNQLSSSLTYCTDQLFWTVKVFKTAPLEGNSFRADLMAVTEGAIQSNNSMRPNSRLPSRIGISYREAETESGIAFRFPPVSDVRMSRYFVAFSPHFTHFFSFSFSFFLFLSLSFCLFFSGIGGGPRVGGQGSDWLWGGDAGKEGRREGGGGGFHFGNTTKYRFDLLSGAAFIIWYRRMKSGISEFPPPFYGFLLCISSFLLHLPRFSFSFRFSSSFIQFFFLLLFRKMCFHSLWGVWSSFWFHDCVFLPAAPAAPATTTAATTAAATRMIMTVMVKHGIAMAISIDWFGWWTKPKQPLKRLASGKLSSMLPLDCSS